jgi:hypothetical protein
VTSDGLDLKRFYAENSRYIWGALSGAMIMFAIAVSVSHLRQSGYRAAAINLLQSYFVLPTLILAVVRNRRAHSILVPVTTIAALALLFRMQLNQ